MKGYGVVFIMEQYKGSVLTRFEGLAVSQEQFAELTQRFREAFPSARWLGELKPGAWLVLADQVERLHTFYIGLFGVEGYQPKGTQGYVQATFS